MVVSSSSVLMADSCPFLLAGCRFRRLVYYTCAVTLRARSSRPVRHELAVLHLDHAVCDAEVTIVMRDGDDGLAAPLQVRGDVLVEELAKRRGLGGVPCGVHDGRQACHTVA